MSSEFDQYADDYSEQVSRAIAFCGQGTDFFSQVKMVHLLAVIQRHFGDPSKLTILDVGCGVGEMDGHLIPHVGKLHGIDVAAQAVERAAKAHPDGHFIAYDGHRIPFEDRSVDVAFAVCVMHHVPPANWPAFLRELHRVVRPGGAVAIYEHNPLNPLTRLAVARCEFDADAVLLRRAKVARLFESVGLHPVVKGYILFFPFRNRLWRFIERGLHWLPLGAQHVVVGRRE